jgi:hypothetical protein
MVTEQRYKWHTHTESMEDNKVFAKSEMCTNNYVIWVTVIHSW